MDAMGLRIQVGREIRRQRESQQLTLHTLAAMSGTSYTHLWKVENGKVSVGLDLLGRISAALGVPLGQLFSPLLSYPSPSGHDMERASSIAHDPGKKLQA